MVVVAFFHRGAKFTVFKLALIYMSTNIKVSQKSDNLYYNFKLTGKRPLVSLAMTKWKN